MESKLYEKTMKRAFNLLSYKSRSKAEMCERLMEKEWADETVTDQVINRLEELGYINDLAMASAVADSRLKIKAIGRTRLRLDLRKRKLLSHTIEAALDQAYTDTPEVELLDRALQKRLALKGNPRSREESKKLFDYLIRRGFSYDLVVEKISKLKLEDN